MAGTTAARATARRDEARIDVVDELRQQARIHRWQAGRLEQAAEMVRQCGLTEIRQQLLDRGSRSAE